LFGAGRYLEAVAPAIVKPWHKRAVDPQGEAITVLLAAGQGNEIFAIFIFPWISFSASKEPIATVSTF
jgi:hypothetical protein